MTVEERAPYFKQSLEDGKRHEKEMKEFNEFGFFHNKDGVKSTFLNRKNNKVNQFEAGTVLPKKAQTAYMAFASKYMKDNAIAGTKVTEKMKEAGIKWAEMSE